MKVLILSNMQFGISADIPYLFDRAGFDIEIVCPKTSYLLDNNSARIHHESFFAQDQDFLEKIEKLVEKQSYAQIVIADDDTLRIINTSTLHQKVLEKILPLVKLENRRLLASKIGFSQLCEKYEIETPAFEIYSGELTGKIGYPLLIKEDMSSGGSGIIHCNNEKEAKENLVNLTRDKKRNFIIQKYIDGENIAVEAFYNKGKLIAYAYCKVLRTLKNEFGVSTQRMYYQYPEIETMLSKIGDSFGIHGFANISMIYDTKQQKHYLIEADPRPQSWFLITRLIGVDFSKVIKAVSLGKEIFLKPRRSQKMFYFTRDIEYSVDHKDYLDIVKWVFNWENRWKSIPFYDRKIFLVSMKRVWELSKKLIKDFYKV